MRDQIVMPVLLKAAEKIGLKILIEPTRGMYAVLLFDDKKKYYVKDINFNLNLVGSVSVTRNKAATTFFLKEFGYSVPDFTLVYESKKYPKLGRVDTVQRGLEFAEREGFPIILKPNNGSQGHLIFKANSEEEYRFFINKILQAMGIAQVQKFYRGNDFRIVVLGQNILSAYQRIPLHVIGTGVHSIKELIEFKQQTFIKQQRDTILFLDDLRIKHKLLEQTMGLSSVPLEGEVVFLQDISNLSLGGETIDLTDQIHPSFKELAINIAGDLNLTLCGIDIITSDLTKEKKDYVVLEVNSAPGLDNYAYEGKKQEIYVENLYTEILTYILKRYS